MKEREVRGEQEERAKRETNRLRGEKLFVF